MRVHGGILRDPMLIHRGVFEEHGLEFSLECIGLAVMAHENHYAFIDSKQNYE